MWSRVSLAAPYFFAIAVFVLCLRKSFLSHDDNVYAQDR